MDKKSMGSFIAALRKAKGWTQKDLAELLHVSDKTVSRWETGDGAPDLALVPVLAELFGVSCDELLRGERKPETDAVETTPLGEKRKKWLFDRIKLRSACFNVAASAISVVALLVTLILPGTGLRSQYHLYIPLAFFVVSVAVQLVGLIRAYIALNGAEPKDEILLFKQKLVFSGEGAAVVTAMCLGAVVAFTEGHDGWWALSIFCALVWGVIVIFINKILRRAGLIKKKKGLVHRAVDRMFEPPDIG